MPLVIPTVDIMNPKEYIFTNKILTKITIKMKKTNLFVCIIMLILISITISCSSNKDIDEVVINTDKQIVGNDKYIEVNQEQYKKIFLEDRNDPAKSMKMAMANGAVLQFRDQNGNEISASEMIKRREQQVKENNKRDNNLLELDLLQ